MISNWLMAGGALAVVWLDGWTSEGWWSVPVDGCTRILTGDLDQRYI